MDWQIVAVVSTVVCVALAVKRYWFLAGLAFLFAGAVPVSNITLAFRPAEAEYTIAALAILFAATMAAVVFLEIHFLGRGPQLWGPGSKLKGEGDG